MGISRSKEKPSQQLSLGRRHGRTERLHIDPGADATENFQGRDRALPEQQQVALTTNRSERRAVRRDNQEDPKKHRVADGERVVRICSRAV